jgi:ketosteroid isomerase-like protein
MRAIRAFLFAGVIALATPHASAAAPADFPKMSAEWAGDWNTKKLDAVMAFYAPDAVFSPGAGGRWEGAAIARNFADLLAHYTADLHLHSARSGAAGDLGYDSGTYVEDVTPVKAGSVIHATGNYLFLFRRQKDGSWKFLEQTWTFYQPGKL